MTIVMYDPGNFTPFYLDGLCGGLNELGASARVITSPPLYESANPSGRYDVARLFFPRLTGWLNAVLRHRTVLRRAVKGLSYPSGVWRTWHSLRSGPPGVLHLHWALLPRLDTLLVRALKRRGWRVVNTVHDPPPAANRPFARRGHQALYAESAAVIVHTPGLAAQLLAAYPELAGRVHVIPHGGTAETLPSNPDRARARRELGLPAEGPLLLFFGMLKPYKGLHDLLEAFPQVLASSPQARLVIAGEPHQSLAPFHRQIERLRLQHAVILRPAFVPQQELPWYFQAASLLVAPYTEIGASGVVTTAQGYGLPVVVTRVGGLPEWVEPDRCGFVVPPRSPEALANALRAALADPQGLLEMGRRGWLRVGRDCRWSEVARRTFEVYATGA